VARQRGARARRARGAVTAHSSRARRRGDTLVNGSVAAGQQQGVAGEHRGSSEETPGTISGNDAHRKWVVDGEAARWQEAVALDDGEGAPVVTGEVRGVLWHGENERVRMGQSI
jgi:hypothetical protein